jgi:hypothetical protein
LSHKILYLPTAEDLDPIHARFRPCSNDVSLLERLRWASCVSRPSAGPVECVRRDGEALQAAEAGQRRPHRVGEVEPGDVEPDDHAGGGVARCAGDPTHVQCSEELVVQDSNAPVGFESAAFTASSASASPPAASAPAARARSRSSARARIWLLFLCRGGGGEERRRTAHTT